MSGAAGQYHEYRRTDLYAVNINKAKATVPAGTVAFALFGKMSGCAAAAQQGDFPGVAIVVIGGLQDEGKPAERRMADDPGKGLQADGSFADASMAILVAGSGIEADIQVDGPETGKADGLVKGGEDTVQIVHDIIYDELCLGEIKAESKQQFIEIIERLERNGAQGIILGCTEIGLLIKQADVALPVFDTTRLHAVAAVDQANNKTDGSLRSTI